MFIGWLERTLVMTALLAGAPDLVGFVIAAQAIIRFRETESHFADYFLLGIFLSLLIAGAGGLILRGCACWGSLVKRVRPLSGSPVSSSRPAHSRHEAWSRSVVSRCQYFGEIAEGSERPPAY